MPAPIVPEETRAQDRKTYTPALPGATPFADMAGVVADVLDGFAPASVRHRTDGRGVTGKGCPFLI